MRVDGENVGRVGVVRERRPEVRRGPRVVDQAAGTADWGKPGGNGLAAVREEVVRGREGGLRIEQPALALVEQELALDVPRGLDEPADGDVREIEVAAGATAWS